MLHKIKIRQEFIEPIINNEKTFEIRKNDRCYEKGDKIKFIPVDVSGNKLFGPTPYVAAIRNATYEITYVLSGWGLQDDYVAFGIKEVV